MMFRPLIVFAALGFAALPTLAQPAINPGPQLAAEQSVRNLILGINSDTAYFSLQTLVSGAAPQDNADGSKWNQWWTGQRGNVRLTLDKTEFSDITKDSAKLLLTYHWMSSMPRFRSGNIVEPLKLVWGLPAGGNQPTWLVAPLVPKSMEEARELGFVFDKVGPDGVVIIPDNVPVVNELLKAVVDPTKAVNQVMSSLTMSNMKQASLAVLQFVMDHDEKYAFKTEGFATALTPYAKTNEVFQDPSLGKLYSFNSNLSGLSLAALNDVANIVLFYEGENEQPIFRYDGKAAVAFTDGHVKLMTPDEMKTVVWKP